MICLNKSRQFKWVPTIYGRQRLLLTCHKCNPSCLINKILDFFIWWSSFHKKTGKRFVCCSSSLFLCRWFHIWRLFCHYLFLIPPYYCAQGRTCFLDCGISWIFSLYFRKRDSSLCKAYKTSATVIIPMWSRFLTGVLLSFLSSD